MVGGEYNARLNWHYFRYSANLLIADLAADYARLRKAQSDWRFQLAACLAFLAAMAWETLMHRQRKM
jgi:hypothetical protein